MVPTVLPNITALKPGDHVCYLYETIAEHRSVLTPFLHQGLVCKEKILYIIDMNTAESIFDYLEDEGLVVEPYLTSGQLRILTVADTYMHRGYFDPEAMIAWLHAETEHALAEGYSALRITSEMTWALQGFPGSNRLIEYEAKLNTFFAENQCLGLCQYDRQHFGPAILLEVLATHPLAIVGTEVYDNVYYLPPPDFLGQNRPAAMLRYWVENLATQKQMAEALRQAYDDLEMRVWERTVELEEANRVSQEEIIERKRIEGELLQSLSREQVLRTEAEVAQQRLAFLAEASSVLASSLDYEATLESIACLTIPMLADWCVIDLLEADGSLRRVASVHVDPEKEALVREMHRRYPPRLDSLSIVSRVLRTGQSEIIHDIPATYLASIAQDEDHLQCILQLDPKSTMAVPLITRGRVLGALSLRLTQTERRYGSADLILAEELARRAALAIDNARLYTELHQSQQMLKLVLDTIPHYVFWKDRESVYLGCNAVFARAVGLQPEEVVGKTDDAMGATPEEAAFFHQIDRQVMEQNTPQYHIIEQVHRPDGRVVWVEANKVPLHNTQGEVMGVLCTYEDITERKQVAEALHESEEKYRKLFEESRDAIMISTREGRYLEVNQSTLDLFGYTREEILRIDARQLYASPADRDYYRQEIEEKGYVRNYEIKLRKKDSTIIDCLSSASVWRAPDGSIGGYLAIVRDITDHKRLESQLRQTQKMEAIGTLAGGIAHDFNNILAAILGYTELALYDVPPESLTQCNLQEVLTAGKRAKDLVEQILTFSRQREQERKPIQLPLIVKEALKLLRASLPATITIQQQIDDTAGIVRADPTQMHQVMMNLCTNAEHAMRKTGGVLAVCLEPIVVSAEFAATHPPLQSGPHVQITVRDTGHGMEPHILERIFEPFFTTKGVGEGTGLGLSMVHGIVTDHHGAITVESTPGQGTTFKIYLPCIQSITREETPSEEMIPGGTECILFVDDEETLACLGQHLLERLGYTVVVYTSSREALEAFHAAPHRFDLVITDQTMPHLTGDLLTKELRQIRPDIPIILCTGFSHTMSAEKALALGINAYLLKPLVARDLALAIRHVFAQSQKENT